MNKKTISERIQSHNMHSILTEENKKKSDMYKRLKKTFLIQNIVLHLVIFFL